MLRSPIRPAQQLKSVALRYRHALTINCPVAQYAVARYADERSARERSATSRQCPAARAAEIGPFRRDEKLARVEALLFLAGEPLGSRKIAHLAGLADGTEARTLIRRLNGFYDSQASAFRVETVGGGFQMLTRPQFGGWLRRLHPAPVETRLSAPAMETLAVVAYRQPVLRAEIESIRGVQCGEILRQLMERDLVRIVGRSEELGRPYLYGTTKRFLRGFGLRSLDDLPRADLLRPRPTENDRPTEEDGPADRARPANDEAPSYDRAPAARRDDELTPRNDLNEEFEVKMVAKAETAPDKPTNRGSDDCEPWTTAALAALALPSAQADEEDDDLDDDDLDDDDDDDDDLDDEDDDLDDEDDLEDDEWEEVDDEDEDWEDEDDEDWDEDDDEEEDDEEEWEDE